MKARIYVGGYIDVEVTDNDARFAWMKENGIVSNERAFRMDEDELMHGAIIRARNEAREKLDEAFYAYRFTDEISFDEVEINPKESHA